MSKTIIDFLHAHRPADRSSFSDIEYTGWQGEQVSWTTDYHIGDQSFLRDIEVRGPDALGLISEILKDI